MSLSHQFDGYCERIDFSFWSEPVNAITNAAFLVAACLTWQFGRNKVGYCGLAPWMIGLVAVIGVGSFLFHTFATRWSALADVIPIALYIYLFFGLAMYRMVGLGRWMSILAALAFLGVSVPAVQAIGSLEAIGSSAGYAPALAALFGVGGYLVIQKNRVGGVLMAAGVVFLLSLTLRTLDEPICDVFPLGLHFLWHCLNAVVLYLTLRALLLSACPKKDKTPKQRLG